MIKYTVEFYWGITVQYNPFLQCNVQCSDKSSVRLMKI